MKINLELRASHSKQAIINKKTFTSSSLINANPVSFGAIIYDKHRFHLIDYHYPDLESLYSQTVALAVSPEGMYICLFLNDDTIALYNLLNKENIKREKLPAAIIQVIKTQTKYDQIGFFTSHVTRHQFLQENSLQLFLDKYGKYLGILTSN